KYGDEVRVVVIGVGDKSQISEAFSKEFCGGIHIDRTGAIGDFKIIKEESVSAGVRRITGLTGSALSDYFTKQSEIIAQLSQTLKVPAELLPERIEKLLNDLKAEKKRAKSSSGNTQDETMLEAKSALEKCEVVGKTSIVTIHLSAASIEQARTAIDMLKKKAESAAIVLGFSEDEKVTLISAVTDDLIKAGLKAGDIIKQIAPIVDGRGGGRPQMAQAGGKEPEKIDDALIEAAKIIKEKLVN
ncbi:MAG: alanine--tRNA ligase, partial [Planctomycetes bacterium]|nr:alanine--tRNA ligase [Planctomycetota bacterium]